MFIVDASSWIFPIYAVYEPYEDNPALNMSRELKRNAYRKVKATETSGSQDPSNIRIQTETSEVGKPLGSNGLINS